MTASGLPERSAGQLPVWPVQPAQPVWRIRLEVEEPESRVAVAIDDDGVTIGMATAGQTRDEDGPTAWELYSINVVAEQQGSGLADELVRVVAGKTDTIVWVATANARAQGFYRRHGFVMEGATRIHEGAGATEITQVRMVRRSAQR